MAMQFLPLIIVLAWMTSAVHGCSCGNILHPQAKFCFADFALYGKVIKEQFTSPSSGNVWTIAGNTEYTVHLLFKMKGVNESIGSELVVQTRNSAAACGTSMTIGKLYIIMGRTRDDLRKTIFACNRPEELDSLTPYQAFYMFTSGPYSYNVNCEKGCQALFGGADNKTDCQYDYQNKVLFSCLAKHALCRRQRGTCHWFNNDKC
ncbi:unnamed protein product [Mytilus coruscus]|uniref:NTR domain-containing protein n=1 Tax=Mytilus coruscus TaxID=42192 RepID=A0A6J8EDQ7_MYTCO|nr:unnamed protein product [Mytilus coruscus]